GPENWPSPSPAIAALQAVDRIRTVPLASTVELGVHVSAAGAPSVTPQPQPPRIRTLGSNSRTRLLPVSATQTSPVALSATPIGSFRPTARPLRGVAPYCPMSAPDCVYRVMRSAPALATSTTPLSRSTATLAGAFSWPELPPKTNGVAGVAARADGALTARAATAVTSSGMMGGRVQRRMVVMRGPLSGLVNADDGSLARRQGPAHRHNSRNRGLRFARAAAGPGTEVPRRLP